MRVYIFIQARMGSKRLPGKIMKKICGKTMFELLVERLKKVEGAAEVVLTTGAGVQNDPLADEAQRLGIGIFRGSEENILDRFYQASETYTPEAIVRIGGDCPLADPVIINELIRVFNECSYDIVGNIIGQRSYPHGLDVEIFSRSALSVAWHDQMNIGNILDTTFMNPVEYIKTNEKFIRHNVVYTKSLQHIRLTVDYPEDFIVVKKIYEHLYVPGCVFLLEDILDFFKKNPHILDINKQHIVYKKEAGAL